MARPQLGLLQMFDCNGTPSVVLTLGKRVGKPNHELVEQAERFALANFQTPLDIPTLCRGAARQQGALRTALQKIRGPTALSTPADVEIIGSKAGAACRLAVVS